MKEILFKFMWIYFKHFIENFIVQPIHIVKWIESISSCDPKLNLMQFVPLKIRFDFNFNAKIQQINLQEK